MKDSSHTAAGGERDGRAIEPLYGSTMIATRIATAGRHLLALDVDDPVILSLLSGSVYFLTDLLRAAGGDWRYEFIHVESAEHGDDGIRELEYPIPFELSGESVILLRDVTATGVIESYLVSQLRQHGAREVQTLSLVNIPARRTTEFESEYSLFTAPPEVSRLVGYGLKYQGRYGSLPYIGQLSRPPHDPEG